MVKENVIFLAFVLVLIAWVFPRLVVSGSVLAIHCLVVVSAQQSLQHSQVNTRVLFAFVNYLQWIKQK